MHNEHRRRSIIKAITYRFVSIIFDTIIAYTVTQSAEKTLIFIVVSNTVSIIMYFVHERAWNRIPWGRRTI